ncbi:MAG: hypothetical protein AAF215_34315 [Cyanobacteria bacterium P01_A01_bin.123]
MSLPPSPEIVAPLGRLSQRLSAHDEVQNRQSKISSPMPPTKILQIVPRLFPDVDGVGDYSLQLAHQLCDSHRIISDFLVFRPSRRTQPTVDRFAVHRLDRHTVEGLLETVPQDISTVVLQYSNYPYLRGKLDTPTWLIEGLNALKQRGLRIVIMFHELPTLRYRFIRCPNPVQRRVSRGLAQVADVVVTNNTAFQQTLASWAMPPVYCMPNFSTIGEPERVKPLRDRSRSLIIFGSSDRSRVYRNNLPRLKQICQQLNIKTLYDIGRPIEWDMDRLAPEVKVIQTGFLPAGEVSELMSNALAGVFDYRRFPHNLAKSTVYAAYCAHGLLPISNQCALRSQDGIIANQHYLDTTALSRVCHQSADLLTTLQNVATSAHNQYRTRTLATFSEAFASLVQPASHPTPLVRT